MYEVTVMDMDFEQCSSDKKRINIIIPYAVIHYVFSGFGYINGQKIGKGYAFSAGKNCHMEYFPDEKDPWSYVYVRLVGQDVNLMYADMGLSDNVNIIPFDKRQQIMDVLSLYQQYENFHDIKAIAANLLLMLHKGEETQTKHNMQEKNVQKIKEYIDNNYVKKMTIADLSKEMHLSSNYIRNLFVKYLGISPKQYMQNKRMDRACELLLKTDMSILLIAYSVGYDDQLLFSRMFSKRFGVSPKNFRNQKK